MKDEKQNLADLIGALTEDIEEIKTIVKTNGFGQGRGIEKAGGETGAVHPFLWRQFAGKYQ